MLPKIIKRDCLRLPSTTSIRRRLITTKEIETVLLGKVSGLEKQNIAKKLDINNDGAVQTKELGATIQGSILDLEKLITETIDDVSIDLPTRNFAEFMIILARRKKQKNKIRILYEEYDSDGSGSVQPEEIKKWMDQHGKPVSKAQAGKISETMDVTGDDRISYEEFLTMIAARLLVLKLQN